ncbi:alpha/beta hydrolase fold domain-containing protein [Hydrogenophaga atypica]|uniref:Alpha/beta hydrolase fold domain-containing protein n=1 Tax=Hydrogenophaga atypica TaxID=249409 RepID=A0ABW2QPK0_9BURK
MTLNTNYTFEAMEPQYNLRALRPDYEVTVTPDWTRRSEAFRATAKGKLDLPYGEGSRERIDFFPAADADAPLLIYFHGGYWQRGDKSMYSFLAEPYVKNGVAVALVNYDLCPSVRISKITPQTRKAVAWLYTNAGELGFSSERIFVMGHSAGGHITGMLLGTDWPAFQRGLPADLIKGGFPLSPLNDLEPVRFSSINDGVKMDAAEAKSESPMYHPPLTNAPQLVVCGARETDEFHRQADMYVETFSTVERPIERYSVPDSDHFDELNVLANENSVFFQKTLELIKRTLLAAQEKTNIATLKNIVKAFNTHNIPAVTAFFAEDGEMLSASGKEPCGTRLSGKAAIADALAKRFTSTPDIQWIDGTEWVSGNNGLSQWTVTWTDGDGIRTSIMGCDIYKFRDGLVVRKDTFYKQRVS